MKVQECGVGYTYDVRIAVSGNLKITWLLRVVFYRGDASLASPAMFKALPLGNGIT